MGILQALGLRPTITEHAVQASFSGTVVDPSTYPIASPWSTSNLERIVFEDIFGDTRPHNTRAAAMRLSPISRGRNLLCTSIGRFPLVQLAAGESEVDREAQPTWLYRSDGSTSPQQRIVWTVDDLIFYGWSCWWRRNAAKSDGGFPIAVGRVNMGDWSIDADNRVTINGVVQADDEVILIGGWHEGILSFAKDDLADAADLKQLVRRRLKNPVPATELHQTGGIELNDVARDNLINSWIAGRDRGDNIGYTNKDIEVRTHGEGIESQLMIEARNASAVELARHIGITAGMVDATAPKASLNYETTTGRNQEFTERDLWLYMDPITARLSLDDLSPRGKRIAFDLADFTGPAALPTGPALED